MANVVVQTVRGPVDPHDLGHTQMHEHLLFGAHGEQREPVRLENYYETRRHRTSPYLTSVPDAIGEMTIYRSSGGQTVVDATPRGLGRDPVGLHEVSEATDLHVVMGSGYYVADYHPPDVAAKTIPLIAQEIIDDLTVGVNGIRAGIIGEIGMSWPVHPDEAKVLAAAVAAQRETGAPLLIHPGRDIRAPMDLVSRVEQLGGNLHRTIMSHVDRTLFSLVDILTLAASGCVVEFDLFGQESSYYEYAEIDMPNDATRIEYLVGLRDRGYLDRLVIAQDICQQAFLRKYGGEGYSHILDNVIPLMCRKGLSSSDIDTITVQNPASLLAW
ncbi:phosphotriesterase family protein [Pedococcus sp. P5_B7]